jgi:4,5-dihydroxyphthalate decarboxylase
MAEQKAFIASCGEFVRTRPLLEGRVAPSGFALDFVPDPFPASGLLADYQAKRNLRMSEERAFEVAEMGLAPLVAARSRGLDLVAIPVFHYRRFRHSAIACLRASKIHKPEDLVGKRVGVRRFSLSAGIWARGLLQHDYGVPLERIHWVVQTATPLRPEVAARLEVTQVPPEEPLERLLLRGELDATIEAYTIGPLREGSPLVHRLFEDPAGAEMDYHRRTGIFPIMHTIVMWRTLAERHPGLPAKLHAAFVQAKALGAAEAGRPTRYVLAEEERAWLDSLPYAARAAFLAGDPWKYSLREDRRTVETFLDYAFEQGITKRRFAVEELFCSEFTTGGG